MSGDVLFFALFFIIKDRIPLVIQQVKGAIMISITNLYETIFVSDINDVSINDQLMDQSVLFRYYFIKALKIVDFVRFIAFAANSTKSLQYSKKELFHSILTLYGEDEYSLKYCHKPEEGLPKLSEFITLATSIKSSIGSTTQTA